MLWLDKFDGDGEKNALDFLSKRRLGVLISALAVIYFDRASALGIETPLAQQIELLPHEIMHAAFWVLILYFITQMLFNFPRLYVEYSSMYAEQDRAIRLNSVNTLINDLEETNNRINRLGQSDGNHEAVEALRREYGLIQRQISESLNPSLLSKLLVSMSRILIDFIRVFPVYLFGIYVLSNFPPAYDFTLVLFPYSS